MKDKNFVIKVADLLQDAGTTDTVEFEHKMTDLLPNLTKEGISGQIFLRGLNKDSVYATLENVHCSLEETCDSCGTTYEREVDTDEYSARFVISETMKNEEQENTDEEIFLINARSESIDIQDMVVQAIKLQDPFIKRCTKCEKKLAEQDDDETDYFEGTSNIIFH